MPQRIAARAQVTLEIRAIDAGLNTRGARHVIDLQHLVEPVQIDRDGGITRRNVDAPYDGCATSGRYDDVAVGIAPRQRSFELGFGTRMRNGIGRRFEIATHRLQQFERMAAVRVHDAFEFVGRHPAL